MNKFEKLKKNTRKEFLLIIKEQEEEIEYIFEEAAREIEKNQNKNHEPMGRLGALLGIQQYYFERLYRRTFGLGRKDW